MTSQTDQYPSNGTFLRLLIPLWAVCIAVVLMASPLSAYAAESRVIEQPDSLVAYVKQQMQQPQADTLTPTRSLLAKNELTGEFNDAYFAVNKLNAGLPKLDPPPNLETPLATLEFFNSASLKSDFALASYALNLNSIEDDLQVSHASDLAQKLDYLLSEQGLYVFDELPDRSDGLIEPALGGSNPIQGIARRSIKLGSINYKNRSVPLYLERVRVEGEAPVWV